MARFDGIWTALNVLANVFAIIVFIAGAKGHSTPDTEFRMYAFAASSFCLVVAIGLQHRRGARNRRTVKAFEKIRWTYVDLQHLASLLNDPQIDAEKIQRQCEVVVDKVAKALSEVTSATCSVCIKLVENDLARRMAQRFVPEQPHCAEMTVPATGIWWRQQQITGSTRTQHS